MGADSRATAGNIIADKHCEKVHYLTQSIYACGAGTAADLDQVRTMPWGTCFENSNLPYWKGLIQLLYMTYFNVK